jgi:carbonic anhydrase/acetyltransferase-like protein (isoleucine patch superfamily)
MTRDYRGRSPLIAESAYVDRSAQVIGNVDIGERSSVWCNATIRGDIATITIGEESNIQDNCCLHVDRDAPLRVGDRVVVGHSVTLHGCTVEDDCLIGMGAVILSRAHIGAGSIVAAGALVPEGKTIPANSLVMGIPGQVKRETSQEERQRTQQNAWGYVEISREYLKASI